MKTPQTKIELSCAHPREYRRYIQHVSLDLEGPDPLLVATDGHCLAVIPVETDDGDTHGPIHIDAIKGARKTKAESIRANGDLNWDGEKGAGSMTRPDVARFPDWRRIVRDDYPEKADIGIDAEILYRLARAFFSHGGNGNLGVELTFGRKDDGSIDPGAPIKVVPRQHDAPDGAFGVLMPRRTD